MNKIVSFAVFCLIALYILYIMVMRWKERREDQDGKLSAIQWLIAGPIVVAGVVLDVFVNLVIATVLFLDWPQELMLTARLQRYLDKPHTYGWRAKVARWLKPHLNRHDPGHLE